MWNGLRESERRARWNIILVGIFFGIAFLFGGASRADVLSQFVVRAAAIILMGISLFQIRPEEWRAVRLPVLFLITIAGIIAIQLIPLPPGVWARLPGHEMYVAALDQAGLPIGWRPLSLAPDLTLNALLAVLPPLAILLGLATVDRSFYPLLVPVLLLGTLCSVLLGLLQISSGGPYFYDITNHGSAVGIFANRNHQALLVAAAFPMLVMWTALPHQDSSYRRLRDWLALCLAALIFPVLLVTGSRAGLALGGLSVLLSAALLWASRRGRHKRSSGRGRWRALSLVPILVGVAAVIGTIFLARDEAVQRMGQSVEFDSRIELLPVFVQMAKDYFPTGAGFGSFDPVFRAYEPDSALSTRYLNNAHNDLAQILIEGGALPVLLALLFCGWLSLQSWRLWSMRASSLGQLLGRAGTIVILLTLGASLVDYPLRTPLVSIVFVIACLWVISAEGRPHAQQERKALAGNDQ